MNKKTPLLGGVQIGSRPYASLEPPLRSIGVTGNSRLSENGKCNRSVINKKLLINRSFLLE